MLDHLRDFDPEVGPHNAKIVSVGRASAQDILEAKSNTAQWLDELGVPDDESVDVAAQKQVAREAFKTLTTVPDEIAQKERIVRLKTPQAVQHLTGMLTAYDWEFVEMAKELRGYTVAKLVEETQNPNANIRLKALGLLGKVTEVGLFTEKIEVKQEVLNDHELDNRIKDKLNKYMGVADVIDVAARAHEANDTL